MALKELAKILMALKKLTLFRERDMDAAAPIKGIVYSTGIIILKQADPQLNVSM